MVSVISFDATELGRYDTDELELIRPALDELGRKSGIAQNLNGPITSWEKFRSSNHRLLVYRSESGIHVGFIKFGKKDLYFYDKAGKVFPKCCECVLDFYVDDSVQRQGLGLTLFNKMLEELNIDPSALAYDRPSPKLISFMSRHFGLTKPDLQPNRYAIFEGFSFV